MKQLPLALGQDAQPDFSNFLPGRNAQVLAMLQDMALPGPPLYLYGPAGSGKTHLLAALAGRVRQEGGSVGWFDANDPLPWEFQEHWTMVVMDGADRLDPAHQQAAFMLFIEAASWSTQVVAAGRLPPVDLAVRDDLRSRLAWGWVHALQAPAEDDVRQALLQEAKRRGMQLGPEVLDYLLTRHARDLALLQPLIHRLDEYSLAQQRLVTVPLLKKMLAEEGPEL
jgi:DnaA family protein